MLAWGTSRGVSWERLAGRCTSFSGAALSPPGRWGRSEIGLGAARWLTPEEQLGLSLAGAGGQRRRPFLGSSGNRRRGLGGGPELLRYSGPFPRLKAEAPGTHLLAKIGTKFPKLPFG